MGGAMLGHLSWVYPCWLQGWGSAPNCPSLYVGLLFWRCHACAAQYHILHSAPALGCRLVLT